MVRGMALAGLWTRDAASVALASTRSTAASVGGTVRHLVTATPATARRAAAAAHAAAQAVPDIARAAPGGVRAYLGAAPDLRIQVDRAAGHLARDFGVGVYHTVRAIPPKGLLWGGGVAVGAGASLVSPSVIGQDAIDRASWAPAAVPGVVALGLLTAGRRSSAARAAGAGALGLSTGIAASQFTRTEQFDDLRRDTYLKFLIPMSVTWIGVASISAVAGRRPLQQGHKLGTLLAKDPAIGKPTKAAVMLLASPLHPVDWAGGAGAAASLIRRSQHPVIVANWKAAGELVDAKAATKAAAKAERKAARHAVVDART